LTTLLTHQELVDWGWRIPYFFGMLIGPAGLYVRAKVVDTPEFIEAEKPATIPISDLLRRHPLPVLLALGISIISNSSFYLLLYIPTFGVKQLHLPEYTGFVATLVGGLILAVGCPLAGHWSDRMARPRIMVIACVLFVLTAYPAFYLMVAWPSLAPASSPSPGSNWSRPATAACCRRCCPNSFRSTRGQSACLWVSVPP